MASIKNAAKDFAKDPLPYLIGGPIGGTIWKKGNEIFDKPYDDVEEANRQAGRESEALGAKAFELGMYGVDRALDQTTPAARQWQRTYEGDGALAGPGAFEKFAEGPNRSQNAFDSAYSEGGALSTPGQLEQLYEQRLTSDDPYTARIRAEGQRGIADSMAARGLQNSGAAIRANVDLEDRIAADRFRRQETLAGQAQDARERRITGGVDRQTNIFGQNADIQRGAQSAAETRLGGAFDRLHGLTSGRANIVQSGTQSAIDNFTAGQMGGINSRLAGANTQLDKTRDKWKTGATVGGTLLGSAV